MTRGAQLRAWWRRHGSSGILAPGDAEILGLGGLAVVVAVGGFWAFATGVDPDTWVPTLMLICLATISVPICLRLGRSDKRLKRILLLGLALKLLSVFPRYYVNEYVYEGEADTGNYHTAGQQVYVNVHEEGEWSLDGALLDKYSDETRAVGYVAGALYLVVGTTYLGGYIVFAWIGWLGLVMAFKAFRVAYPNAPPHLAAGLLFFLPSVLYWPSSVGKDAVMVLCLGGVVLALARLLTPARPLRGLLLLVPTGWLMLQIRPHLLMIALVGAAASLFVRNADKTRAKVAIAMRVVLLAALVPGILFGISRMDETFGDPNEEAGFSVSAALGQAHEQTSIGGSAFQTQPVDSPLDLPIAIVSVLYRPFPFEVDGVAVFISALEGTALLIATFAAGRWIWRVGPAAWSHPFAAFCLGYVLAFVFAFSNVGNAAILSRQRVQLFPILVLLVAAAREHHRRAVVESADDAPAADVPSTPSVAALAPA